MSEIAPRLSVPSISEDSTRAIERISTSSPSGLSRSSITDLSVECMRAPRVVPTLGPLFLGPVDACGRATESGCTFAPRPVGHYRLTPTDEMQNKEIGDKFIRQAW